MLIKYNNHLIGVKYFDISGSYTLVSILKPIEPNVVNGGYSRHFYKHLIYYSYDGETIYFNWNGNTFGISFVDVREECDCTCYVDDGYYHLFKVGSDQTDTHNQIINKSSTEYYNFVLKIIDFIQRSGLS